MAHFIFEKAPICWGNSADCSMITYLSSVGTRLLINKKAYFQSFTVVVIMYLHYSFCVLGAEYRPQLWSRIRYDENHDDGLLRNDSETQEPTRYLKHQPLHIEQSFIKHLLLKGFVYPLQNSLISMVPMNVLSSLYPQSTPCSPLSTYCLFIIATVHFLECVLPSLACKLLEGKSCSGNIFNLFISSPSTAPSLLQVFKKSLRVSKRMNDI